MGVRVFLLRPIEVKALLKKSQGLSTMYISNERSDTGLRAFGISGLVCLGLLVGTGTTLAGPPAEVSSPVESLAMSPHPAAVETEGPQEFDPDSLSPGRLSPVGISEGSFNPVEYGFGLSIDNASFDTRRGHISVFHNGRLVPDDKLTVSDSLIELPAILKSGRNVVEVSGADSGGRLLDVNFVFWAGTHRLQGVVVGREGNPVPDAKLTVQLIESPGVTASGRSDAAGGFQFEYLPPNVVHIEGRAKPDLFGSMPVNGDDGMARLVLFDILPPSDVGNNDFSLGLEGWEIDDSPVFLVPHDQELFKYKATPHLER